MKVFDKTWKLAVAGALVGVLAALLAYFGNPANMAICIACFVRDTALPVINQGCWAKR